VPADVFERRAGRVGLDPRNQARRLPHAGAPGGRPGPFTRGGHDWADRYVAVVDAALRIKARSFVIDGELVCCGDDGRADFARLRSRRHDCDAFVYAFDLLRVEDEDLRALPIERRKARLARLIKPAKGIGIALVEHVEDDGPTIFRAACRMGLEGIVSKRIDSRYTSGRCADWRKAKNPACMAVRREEEEEWAGKGAPTGRGLGVEAD
jgi:bifunctional non-homologous end joining protein LigD